MVRLEQLRASVLYQILYNEIDFIGVNVNAI